MVSIIVPMYNAEKYIDRCLGSILGQSYEDIEVIVINDGSTDSSFEHAYVFAERDKRVHVVTQDNQGLVYSRKQGIMRAQGEYTLFIDSDDYIEPDMVENLVRIAEDNGADAVLSGAILQVTGTDADVYCGLDQINHRSITDKYYRVARNFAEERFYDGKELDELKQQLFCAEDYCTMAVLPYLWNKLWRTSVIKDFVLECDEKIRVGEDVAIGFPALLTAKRVAVTNKAYYHYCQYMNSMMRSGEREEAEYENAVRLRDYLVRKCGEIGAPQEVMAGIKRLFMNQLYTRCYGKVNELSGTNGFAGFTTVIPENLVIYGAGELGKAIYKYAEDKCHIKAWIDSAFEFQQALGYEVISSDEYTPDEKDVVIIAVFNVHAVEAIRKKLLDKGCRSEMIFSFEG